MFYQCFYDFSLVLLLRMPMFFETEQKSQFAIPVQIHERKCSAEPFCIKQHQFT